MSPLWPLQLLIAVMGVGGLAVAVLVSALESAAEPPGVAPPLPSRVPADVALACDDPGDCPNGPGPHEFGLGIPPCKRQAWEPPHLVSRL